MLPYSSSAADSINIIKTEISECSIQCGMYNQKNIALKYKDSAGVHAVTLPTSMDHVNEIAVNSTGNIIVTGSLKNSVTIFLIVDPKKNKTLSQIWTLHSGISPDRRYISFAPFMGMHGYDSLYNGTMLYVYDTETTKVGRADALEPEQAIPIYPRSLIEKDRNYVIQQDPSTLMAILSRDIRWDSTNQMSFVVGYASTLPAKASVSRHDIEKKKEMYHITITMPDGQKLAKEQSVMEQIVKLKCDRGTIEDWSYQSITTACK